MEQEARVRRRIGPVETIARGVVGATFLAPALSGACVPSEWVLGLVGYRTRRDSTPISATGPAEFALNLAGFLTLYLTPVYLAALAVTNDSDPIFYGVAGGIGCTIGACK